jgi:hypothetical protein
MFCNPLILCLKRTLGTPISRSARIALSGRPDAHSRARKPDRGCRRRKAEPDGADLEIGVPRQGGRARRNGNWGFHSFL